VEDAPKRDPSLFDRLLNKYIAVWLWSILFGTTTGVLYSFLSFRYERWGTIGIVLVVPAVFALVLALMSWLQLYAALRRYLLPKFFSSRADREPDPELFAYHLLRAFFYFIFAASVRALASIMESLLVSMRM
jgi:hypothetical protein